MTLALGTRLGPYEILAPLGAGGMGEVYRATDTNLKRPVAIKVLPASVAGDAERLARFQREAQVLASLNHPNIAHIHGLERVDGTIALVMELVEGPTLADRIARGAIPIDEALPIAKQIVEALEAAHEQGIIHRDLKPANIKVRGDGTVKVLDFGLAKTLDPVSSAINVSQSPTITTPAMTQAGMILGTAAYMSPEQAKGRPVDKRSDVWAFGCVLYEMLTGKRAFAGEDVSEILANVLKVDPAWDALAPAPAGLRRLLRRCLEKDPKRRLQAIGDASLDIEELLNRPDGSDSSSTLVSGRRSWRVAVPWIIAAAAIATTTAVVVLWLLERTTAPAAPYRLSVDIGADASLVTGLGSAAILSPDGTLLAFVARPASGQPRLYIRRLDQLRATALPDTDGAFAPFFSPDGQWIAFFTGGKGKLKKVSINGGAPLTLCDIAGGRGGTWADDDTIVFNYGPGVSLMRVSAAGGKPDPVTRLAEGEVTQRWPQLLPGGRALLYTSCTTVGTCGNAAIMLQPLPAGPAKVLVRGGYYARYLRSGHLVYLHDGTLFAAPFDLDHLALTGSFVPVIEHVSADTAQGEAEFAASNTGAAVFVSGDDTSAAVPVMWLDRSGRTTPLRASPADWRNIQFSPDGRRVMFDLYDGRQADVWIDEWARDTVTRLTFDAGEHRVPVWTPDSRRVVFQWTQPGSGANLYWRRADGVGDIQRLTTSSHLQYPSSWHPSGKLLAFVDVSQLAPVVNAQAVSAINTDVKLLPMEGDEATGWKPGTPTTLLGSRAAEAWPAFSPDGGWIAYQSNESGQSEIYVQPFPGPGGKWQVSTSGGTFPV